MLNVEPTEPDTLGEFQAEDDISLMLRVQQGDVSAFALLAGRYRTRLQRFFSLLLPDPTLSDDFAQETLLRLYLSREQYRPTGSFRAYLFQIGRHYYLNHRVRQQQKRRHELPSESDDALTMLSPPRTQPEFVALERWEEEKRRRAIAALAEPYRLVFTLSHFEGLKYAEIAERLCIPVGTVKSRMAEAVRRLRQALEAEDES